MNIYLFVAYFSNAVMHNAKTNIKNSIPLKILKKFIKRQIFIES